MQTYIDCVHVKKADKGRMQAEDPMEVDKESNKEGEQERDKEGDTSDAANEAKVLGMPCFQLSFLLSLVQARSVIKDL